MCLHSALASCPPVNVLAQALLPGFCILIIFLAVAAIQHRKRHDSVHHVRGVDMRGIEKVEGYRNKIQWLKSRPDRRKGLDPNRILYEWEQRDAVLDRKEKQDS